MITAEQRLSKARATLLIDQPFFGSLALRLELVADPSIGTLAVDGRRMFYSPQFVAGLPEPELQAGVAHEVMHCVLDHIPRMAKRNHKRWNAACDYVINLMLRDAGFKLGAGWLYDLKYRGMSAEHVYELLPEDSDSSSFDEMRQPQPGAGDSANDDAETLRNDWEVATIQAAKSAQDAGALPGSMRRFLTELLSSKVNWREQLRRYVVERTKNDYVWTRPNRRIAGMPVLHSETMGHMVVVIDTSGSIDTPTLTAFASEIESIRDAVSPQTTTVIYCDAAINRVDTFDVGVPLVVNACGGGGTSFFPPFQYVDDQGIAPACLVYLTDGYARFPPHAPAYPVVWCMTTDVEAPWGEHVQINL